MFVVRVNLFFIIFFSVFVGINFEMDTKSPKNITATMKKYWIGLIIINAFQQWLYPSISRLTVTRDAIRYIIAKGKV